MIIQAITWQQSLPIRHKVLWPNKPEIFCQIEEDKDADHYGAFLDDQLVCVASLYSKSINGITRVRLRKFATLEAYQGKGIGRKLLEHMIKDLTVKGVDYFWCDARKSAVEFYKKSGFKSLGNEFYKFDIAYYKMEVKLN
jgi:ribosomal protein S18 acetylase RimI-like enzyme